MPAVGLTDHGSLAGAVQLYKEASKQGVKPIIGCEVYVCNDASKQEKGYAHLTLLAESTEGYGNLIKLASAGYLQGYYYKPRVDWGLLETHAKGVIALSGCLSGRVSKALEESREADAAADLDRLVQVFGRESTYVEIQNAGLAEQARINPQLAKLAEGTGPPARRDRRRALPAPRRRARTRGAPLHPVGRLAEEPESLEVRHRPVLLQDARRDGGRLRRVPGRAREDARGRGALLGRDRARLDPPAEVPGARGPRCVRLPRRVVREGPREALRPRHAGDPGAAQVRAEDDPRDGLRGLLPDRLGLRQLREAERRLRRPGPRLDGGLTRRVRARHHRGRPDEVRPPLRALPQPGAQVDAGHGHRLLGRRPRPGDQLRGREVRARPRGADHHVRDDDGARRGARRGTRARGSVRHRRQGREAHPRGREGLPRRLPEAGLGAQGGVRRGSARARDRRPREAARGARAPGLDPRRGRRHLGPAADRRRASAAEGRGRGDGHAVRDVGRRGARPAEDGLPRAAQPRRDRQGGRPDRERAGHRQAPARRPQDVRDARARRRDRRLPVRVVGHARGAALGSADGVRGPDRPRRFVPAWADGLHPGVREAQERAGGGLVHRPAARGDHRGHARDLHLPGAVPRDREADRGLLAGRGGRPAQGDRQEDPRADGVPQGEVPRGLRADRDDARRREPALEGHGVVAGLLLREVARGLLRADRVPDGLAAREPPARVHGCADLVRDEHEGPRARST